VANTVDVLTQKLQAQNQTYPRHSPAARNHAHEGVALAPEDG